MGASGTQLLRRSVDDLIYYSGLRVEGGERWTRWGMTNLTRIQKALWLCRGLWGTFPTCRNLLIVGEDRKGVSCYAPLHAHQANEQLTKNNHPPNPHLSYAMLSTTRPGGNTSFGENRNLWRKKGNRHQEEGGKKTATEVHELWGCDVM